MNSTNQEPNPEIFTTDPPLALLQRLTVRALQPHEYGRAGDLLDREHYLGDVPQGRQLLQVIEYDGQWVALLDWGPARMALRLGPKLSWTTAYGDACRAGFRR